MDFIFWPLIFLFALPVVSEWLAEPAPGLFETYTESKKKGCEFVGDAAAQNIGILTNDKSFNVSEDSFRTSYFEKSYVRCRPAILDELQRDRRDNLILANLSRETESLAARVSRISLEFNETRPQAALPALTWEVHTLGFSSSLSQKIRVALETSLAQKLRVAMATEAAELTYDSGDSRDSQILNLGDNIWSDENWKLGEELFAKRKSLAETLIAGACEKSDSAAMKEQVYVVNLAQYSVKLFAAVCLKGNFQWLS